MNNKKQHKITLKIADTEPFAFETTLEEEPIYRKAAYHVNQFWETMRAKQPDESSHFILAKVALAFAEVYYRKLAQLEAQSKLIDDFEKDLDGILMRMED